MRKLSLGIIGGCLSHQNGIPLSKIYHRQLAKLLLTEEGTDLRVRVARDFDKEYLDRLESLGNLHELDAVLVHIRASFSRKTNLIVSAPKGDEIHYFAHPFLLTQWKSGYAQLESSFFKGSRAILIRRKPRVSLNGGLSERFGKSNESYFWATSRSVARWIGRLIGLQAWAIRDEIRMLRGLISRCNALRLPLYVMGPTRVLSNSLADSDCRQLDRRLQEFLSELSIPYCSLPESHGLEGASFYLADGSHLTPCGHTYVAEQLFDSLRTKGKRSQ